MFHSHERERHTHTHTHTPAQTRRFTFTRKHGKEHGEIGTSARASKKKRGHHFSSSASAAAARSLMDSMPMHTSSSSTTGRCRMPWKNYKHHTYKAGTPRERQKATHPRHEIEDKQHQRTEDVTMRRDSRRVVDGEAVMSGEGCIVAISRTCIFRLAIPESFVCQPIRR